MPESGSSISALLRVFKGDLLCQLLPEVISVNFKTFFLEFFPVLTNIEIIFVVLLAQKRLIIS